MLQENQQRPSQGVPMSKEQSKAESKQNSQEESIEQSKREQSI
jgi:hypothetical protein